MFLVESARRELGSLTGVSYASAKYRFYFSDPMFSAVSTPMSPAPPILARAVGLIAQAKAAKAAPQTPVALARGPAEWPVSALPVPVTMPLYSPTQEPCAKEVDVLPSDLDNFHLGPTETRRSQASRENMRHARGSMAGRRS